MQELNTNIITHKLKIKWEWESYITKKNAENIFQQLTDPNKSHVIIANYETMTYITKFKSEVELINLKDDENNFEFILHKNWLKEHEKEKIRDIRKQRKKENKSLTNWVLQNIINSILQK
jgi:hypothetical protein